MSNVIGLLVLGLIIGGFVAFFLYFNRQQRIEVGEDFARERGWQFQDVLPEFVRAQRQHIFRGKSSEGIEWELVLNLKQSTTQTVPVASTIWRTEQIRSKKGIVLIGPKLGTDFDSLDLSSPLANLFFRTILGDEAEQVRNLHRLPVAGQDALMLLATDTEYGATIITEELLRSYQKWVEDNKGESRFPILYLGESGLQFKVRRTLTKAIEVDAFVNFCVKVAAAYLQ